MDTVSMLNKMSFYCQPILPLVYDESMSYYETLCKVVGQLNTTGDAVNKLNEGLTGEIADRQTADSELDERLKLIEATNAKIHFLVFDGANPNGGFPTRSELYKWVHEGDAIFTLFRTYEEGRGQIYAASCSYNAGNWGSEASNDFSIIVPLETSYDAAQDYAVRQKVAKLSIPLSPQTNLNVAWGLQIIEVNTPYTSAEGVVNLVAVINDSDSVNCSITPSEFLGLYNTTRGGKNLCVAVNAKLAYDGLARSSSVATVDTTNRKIRIAFECDHGAFINNGVKQLNKTLDYIIGDATTNVWTHETIDSRTLDFSRYEGFQFTRGENNVITANDESTPNAVYAQYHSDTSGKIYQNLPVRLVDTVDNAEYWNGVFGIKDDRHMTFTFVTSNYVTASGKMLVRVIELSADTDTTTWKYAEKEFTLPLSGGSAPAYVDFWWTGQSEVYDNDLKGWTVSLGTDKTFDYIFDLISSGANVVARLYKDSTKAELVSKSIEASISGDKTLGFINFLFMHAADDVAFGFTTIADAIWITKTSAGTSAYALYKWCALPAPTGDSTDNGKVPTINGSKWELKAPSGGGSADAVLYTAQTLTNEQKKQARDNIDAASDFVANATSVSGETITLDKTFAQIMEAIDAGKTPIVKLSFVGTAISIYIPLTFKSDDHLEFSYADNMNVDLTSIYVYPNNDPKIEATKLVSLNKDGTAPQYSIEADPTSPMEIATKQYVDNHAGGAPITIKLGTGNAATSTATFAEIKAALEAGKAPILDSAPGTTHWFALNWTLSGSDSLTIQYGTFNVEGGGEANFTIDDVSVSSTGITYAARQFTSQ